MRNQNHTVISADFTGETIALLSQTGSGEMIWDVWNGEPSDGLDFFRHLSNALGHFRKQHPLLDFGKTVLMLSDEQFLMDTVHVPNLGWAMTRPLELAVSSRYPNRPEWKLHTYLLEKNPQLATYGIIGIREQFLTRLTSVCGNFGISPAGVTFGAHGLVRGAAAVDPRLKKGNYLLLDVKRKVSTFAFRVNGVTTGGFRLPFGYEILRRDRLADKKSLLGYASASQDVECGGIDDCMGANFQIFVQWCRFLLAENPEISARTQRVYVNLPQAYHFLFGQLEPEENLSIRPLPAGHVDHRILENLELFGGLSMSKSDKIHVFSDSRRLL